MNKLKKKKTEKLKFWKFENFQIQWLLKKNYQSRSNLYSNTLKKQSKRIIETEPTRWQKSKDPWKSEWVRHFNKRFSMEYWEVSIKKT